MGLTHTYAVLDVSPDVFQEIRNKLERAGYGHTFIDRADGGLEIDMHGIALAVDPAVLKAAQPVTIDSVAETLKRPDDSARHEAMRQAALGTLVGETARASEIARKVLAGGPDVFAWRCALVAIRDGEEPVWPENRKDLR